MLQKDKDRLGYAEGMSEEEAKKLQMDTYMQMYKSGNIDKEILQPAKNLAKLANKNKIKTCFVKKFYRDQIDEQNILENN